MNSIVSFPIAAAVPVVASAISIPDHDARLIELEEKIFELIHAMDEFEPEMSRLQQVWSSESIRRYNEVQYGSSTLSAEDRNAVINAAAQRRMYALT
jgi:hypothetical protein